MCSLANGVYGTSTLVVLSEPVSQAAVMKWSGCADCFGGTTIVMSIECATLDAKTDRACMTVVQAPETEDER